MYDVIWDPREGRYVARHENLRTGNELHWSARLQEDEWRFVEESRRMDRYKSPAVIMTAGIDSYATAVRFAELGPWPRLGPYE